MNGCRLAQKQIVKRPCRPLPKQELDVFDENGDLRVLGKSGGGDEMDSTMGSMMRGRVDQLADGTYAKIVKYYKNDVRF